jgi:hypothetical protein
MTAMPDPLETELSALRPREVSPELRQRVAERLADAPPSMARRLWVIVLASGLAAACLIWILLWRGRSRVEPEPFVKELPPPLPVEVEEPAPTLLAYQRALARSPQDLDALLEGQATNTPEPVPFSAFTRSKATLDALLGDD